MQLRLDAFEMRITRYLGSGQTLSILEVKVEVAEIRRMVDELYARPFILKRDVMNIMPEV